MNTDVHLDGLKFKGIATPIKMGGMMREIFPPSTSLVAPKGARATQANAPLTLSALTVAPKGAGNTRG